MNGFEIINEKNEIIFEKKPNGTIDFQRDHGIKKATLKQHSVQKIVAIRDTNNVEQVVRQNERKKLIFVTMSRKLVRLHYSIPFCCMNAT